jgi:hypothetical protein
VTVPDDPLTARRDVTLSIERVNLIAIPVALVPLVLVIVPYLFVWGWSSLIGGGRDLVRWYVFVPAIVGGILLHELIHGISWMLFGRKPIRTIRFGVQWKTVTPYAHCNEPMPASAYRWGAAMPGILLGLVPAALGLATGNGGLTLYGTIFLVAASGDFIILWLLRSIPGNILVEDHPAKAGCYVYDDGAAPTGRTS